MADPAEHSRPTDLPSAPTVSVGALFLTFAEISLSSFGGALAWARRILVERRQWLSDRQFAEAGFRAVPGAIVRRGAYVAPGAVLMPSFTNTGAYVGENSMIASGAQSISIVSASTKRTPPVAARVRVCRTDGVPGGRRVAVHP